MMPKASRQSLVRTERMSDYTSLKRKFLPGPHPKGDLDTTDPRKLDCLDVPTPGVDPYLDDNQGAQ